MSIPESVPIEFSISFPAPKISAPFALFVLFAMPTTLLAIPDKLDDELADSMLLSEPTILAPIFCVTDDDQLLPLYFPEIIEYVPRTEENAP